MKKRINDKIILAYTLKNAIEHEGKAQPNSVLNSLFHEGLEKSKIKQVMPKIQETVKKVNSMPLEQQEQKFKNQEKQVDKRKGRVGLAPLPGAKKGKVIMRFSPSPSGPLHIGHALTASISFLYVQKYGGKFYVQIEDTNPENIYKPAYKMIEEESKWLFKNKAKIIIQSERMALYYKYIGTLIKKQAIYVCTCQQEEFKNFIEKQENCHCRKNTIKENLQRWKKMLDKSTSGFKEGEAVVRFKSGMQNKNPAFRDFPLARINLTEHPLQRKKYRVWPLMNLAVAVDDIELKKTHIIRAKEHRDNAERQKMIFKALGKKYPWAAYLGRLHFKDLHLSTTQMRKDIEAGKYKGWDDLRLPTIASLKKQGYKPEAFWKFSEQVGLSETDKVMSKEEYFKLLNSFNKR